MTPLSPDAQAALDFVTAANRGHLIFELAGVFWLWAEVLILIAVTAGHRLIRDGRMPRWAIAATVATGGAVSLAALLAWRHTAIADNFLELIAGEQATPLVTAYTASVQNHLLLWCVFVAGWVALESAIVWQGVRVYRRFARWCNAVGMLLLIALCSAASAQAHADGAWLSAVREADASLQPLRNAVYLYLRIAGVAWIAVEWIAAVLLLRGQAMLWKVARHA